VYRSPTSLSNTPLGVGDFVLYRTGLFNSLERRYKTEGEITEMAYLSVQLEEEQMFVGCANPIFLISDMRDGALIFEVFEDDAASLKLRLGKRSCTSWTAANRSSESW